MQIPKRRSQTLQFQEEQDHLITAEKLERLKRELEDIQKRQRPKTVEDLAFAKEQGDLSENAEYQDAKARLARFDSRIFSLKERIKNAQVIARGPDASGRIKTGSTVVVLVNGKEKSYQILGVQESEPARGRISYLSPLGEALLGHEIGETILLSTDNGAVQYQIMEVK